MQSENRIQPWWYNPVTGWTKNVQPVLFAGIGLVVVLGGLAALNPLFAIAAGLLLLLLVVVLPRPILIVYGLVLTQPLVGGLARGAVVPILRVGQALLVVGFILFMLAKSGRLGKSRLTAIDLAFILFFLTEAVFPLLALLYRGEHLDLFRTDMNGESAIQGLLGPIQYYLLYRIVVSVISTERQIITVLKLSFVASIIVSAIGILEKAIMPFRKLVETYYPPVGPGYTIADVDVRIASTLSHYSGLGAYLGFIIILALACYTERSRLKIPPLLLSATMLLNSIALVLTGTLAAWIGLAIGAVVVFLLVGRLPKLVIFVLIGIALGALFFQPFLLDRLNGQLGAGAAQGLLPQTLAFRIMLWKEIFLPAIGQNLVFGAGPSPAVLQYWSTEESQYLLLLLRGGLPYFFSYLLLIGVAFIACSRKIKNKSEGASRTVAIALLAILVAMSFMNITAEYFTYVGGTQVLWTLLAIVVASGQFKKLEPSTASKPIISGSRRVVGPPFYNSPALAAATVNGPLIGPYLAREKNATGSYYPFSNFTGLRVNAESRYRRYFTRMQRLLDWHFVKDSVIVGAGFTVSRVLGLVFVTLLARFLTPDDFGFFRYVIALVSIITIVSNSSPNSIARFLAAHPNDSQTRDRYFTNGLVGLALVLVLSLFISFPLLWLLHALDLGALICVICLAVFYGYFYIVRGLSSAWKMGLLNVVSNIFLVLALLIVIGLFNMRTATIALVIYGLADVAPILVMELVRPITLRFRPSLISRAALLELARFAMPIVIASGTYTVWFEIDILLIGNFYPHMAGSYATAKTLSLAFVFVPSAITMVLMPKVAASRADKGKRYMAGAVLTGFLLCLAGLVIVGLWGRQLISLTFGGRYSDAYLPLLVLGIGMSFYSIYIILEAFILGRGRPSLAVKALGVALVSTAATGIWLTPRLAMLGTSLSFTIGAILGTMVMLFNTWRFLRKERQPDNSEPSGTNLAPATIN